MFNEFHYQVRGRGHEADGTRGQDRTAYLKLGGVQALCLADGAGSAPLSEFGAQAVVDEGCAILVDRFAELSEENNADRARSLIMDGLLARLEVAARGLECEVAEIPSTFLAVAASRNRFIAAHVGDGAIGYVKNGDLRIVSAPDNSEFANETTFVTSAGAVTSLRLFRGPLDGVEGFILMSDGTSDSLLDQQSHRLAPACAKLITFVGNAPRRQVRNPEHKKRLRRIMDTQIRAATRDDCSIGILGRRQRLESHRVSRF